MHELQIPRAAMHLTSVIAKHQSTVLFLDKKSASILYKRARV
jgi:hypothetical protein